jgi:hypothetical protein
MEGNATVNDLSLAGNQITNYGAFAFCGTLKVNHTLTTLNLDANKSIGQGVMDSIKQALNENKQRSREERFTQENGAGVVMSADKSQYAVFTRTSSNETPYSDFDFETHAIKQSPPPPAASTTATASKMSTSSLPPEPQKVPMRSVNY